MSLIKKFITVSGLTIISRILGVAREILLSCFLGACAEMDAYLIAFKFPCFFRKFFAEGGFQSIFVPYFTDFIVKKKLKAAGYFSSRIFSIIFWWMLFFSIIVFIFAKQFVLLMAPGFSSNPDKLAFAIEFTRIIFPSIIFLSVSTIYSSILVANKRFFLYSLSPILVNIILIISLLSFQNSITAGYRISLGVLLAGIIQFIYLCIAVKSIRLDVPSIGKVKNTPKIKEFFKKLIPILGGAGVAQVNIFMDSLFSSFLPTGCITYIYLADRFVQLPLALFGISIGTIMLSEISTLTAKKNIEEIKELSSNSILFTLLLTIPSSIILIMLAYPFIAILYGHGKFSEQAILNTVDILKIFALGLPAYIIAKVLSSILFSQKDSKTPTIAAICSIITNIALNAFLIVPLQAKGIAISTTVSGFVNAYIVYRKSKNYIKINSDFVLSILKILFSSVVMSGITIMIFLICKFGHSTLMDIMLLLLCISCSTIAYFLTLLIVNDKHAKSVVVFLKSKVFKRART
ncbi:MAG: murein biosynthesis integral membrane protein MurJ [Holosporales bacterium]|jgi:putative peptidoglycan lipid II flippase|nr:murein biosynthesis integral membrane protein MurJ [Holosporales bacterium]